MALLAVPTTGAAARPGALDATFGVGGIVMRQFGSGADQFTSANAVARQPDGRIVVAGYTSDDSGRHQVMVARFNPNGRLDSHFAAGGVMIGQLGAGGAPASTIAAVGLQRDGKIVLVGDASGARGDHEVLVARLDRDGSLDRSLAGHGYVRRQYGASKIPFSEADDVAVQRDGKLVVTGVASDARGPVQFMVTRIRADGSTDRGFGVHGVVLRQLGRGRGAVSGAYAVGMQTHGRIVVGCSVEIGGSDRQVIARLNRNGGFDRGFGRGGLAQPYRGPDSSTANDVAITAGGKIVTTGALGDAAGRYQVLTTRLTSAGRPDGTFGSRGVVHRQLSNNVAAFSDAGQVAGQPNGKLVIAGVARDAAGRMRTFVIRLTPRGAFDHSFGAGGVALHSLGGAGPAPIAEADAVALQPDGRIVLAGLVTDAGGFDELLVARLLDG